MALSKPSISLIWKWGAHGKLLCFASHVSRGVLASYSKPVRIRAGKVAGMRQPTRRNIVYFTFFWLQATKNKTVYVNQNVCQHKFNMYDSLPASVWSLVVCVWIWSEAHIRKINASHTPHHIECNAKHFPAELNVDTQRLRSVVECREFSGRRFGLYVIPWILFFFSSLVYAFKCAPANWLSLPRFLLLPTAHRLQFHFVVRN